MSPETIRSSFTMAAWGMVLALFDFHINGVVLTPDVVGYILIAVGLGRVTSLDSRFQTCATLAWALAPISLAEYVPLFGRDLVVLALLVGFLVAVLLIALLLALCTAVESAAQRGGLESLMESASKCRTLVVIYLVAILCLLLVQSLRIGALLWLVIPAFVFSLVLIVMIFLMLARAGRELGAESLTE
jgi:hypothetical protein